MPCILPPHLAALAACALGAGSLLLAPPAVSPAASFERLTGGAVVAPEQEYELTIKVKSRLGAPLEARVSVLDAEGDPVPPLDPSIPFYTSYSGHAYFYSSGTAVVRVPGGPVRVIVSRGPEYEAVDETITVDTMQTVTYRLRPLFTMRRDGWYSGDTHVHEAHGGEGAVYTITPEDLGLIAKGEDLGVTCVLSNGPYFTGAPDPAGSAANILYFGMEYRSALFGHLGLLGLSSLLPPGCCLPEDPPYPSNHEVIEAATAQGATVSAAHPVPMNPELYMVDTIDWPYSGFARELPVDAVMGGIDAFDIYSYSNYSGEAARDVWYDLLNLGYRIAPSAGTDASVNRYFDPPIGGYRVYVRLQPGQTFTLESWLAGLRAGRCFVTNGPLVHDATLQGAGPGESVVVSGSAPNVLSGWVNVVTREPVEYMDVIHNGVILSRLHFPPHGQAVALNFSITVPPGDGWVVFILHGSEPHAAAVGDFQEAVTAPIYLVSDTPNGARSGAVLRFTEWIDQLDLLVQGRDDGGRPDLVSEVLDLLRTARRRIIGKPGGPDIEPPDVYELTSPDRPSLRAERSGRGFLLRGEGRGEARLEVFDVLGRLVLQGPAEPLPRTFAWDGGTPRGRVPAGVYFARLNGAAVSPAVRIVLPE